MGSVGHVRGSGSVSLGENGMCQAPSALRQGGALGSAVGTRLAGSAGNLEMGIFLSVDDLYMWTEAGLWELPATDQAVGAGAKSMRGWLW